MSAQTLYLDAELVHPGDRLVGDLMIGGAAVTIGTVKLVEHMFAERKVAIYLAGHSEGYACQRDDTVCVVREVAL